MTEATYLLGQWIREQAEAGSIGASWPEVIPAPVAAMTAGDAVPMPILSDPAYNWNGDSLTSVFIGSYAEGAYNGHYLTLATNRRHPFECHVYDSLSGFTGWRNRARRESDRSPQTQSYLNHLRRVGAMMLRQNSTSQIRLIFHTIPEQGTGNSCGAFSLLNLAALLFQVGPVFSFLEH